MNSFRLFAYLGFCTASVWCVTNTPIGEMVLKKFRFVEVPPATHRSERQQQEYWRRVRLEEASSQASIRGEKIDLDAHFAQFPVGETIVLQPMAPEGIDPNTNSQKLRGSSV